MTDNIFRDNPPNDKGYPGFTALKTSDHKWLWTPEHGEAARERLLAARDKR